MRLKSEKGQAMVETALILPLLLLILFGIIDFGWLFYNKISITNCAREGARYAAANYDISEPAQSEAAVKNRVQEANTTSVTVETTLVVEGEGAHQNNYLKVTVSADVPVLTPIIGAFFTDNICPMTSTATMYREQAGVSST